MREAYNPNKNKKTPKALHAHRIIIPLHIPALDSYHKDALKIFELSLNSLKSTAIDTPITVVLNDCAPEIETQLFANYQEKGIDELIISRQAGKINSILKGIRGSGEKFITIADADILFLNGWLENTSKVFREFPKAGVVGIIPQFKMYENLGYNVIYDNLFSRKLKFHPVKNPLDMEKFYESINWEKNYNKDYLKYTMTVFSKADVKALVGSGHAIATYKRELFDNNLPFSEYLLGGNSMSYLDQPVVEKGYWRLTTEDNYAYHMGNIFESWMEEINFSSKNRAEEIKFPELTFKPRGKIQYFLKNKLFPKLFKFSFFKKWFFRYKKLPAEMINTY